MKSQIFYPKTQYDCLPSIIKKGNQIQIKAIWVLEKFQKQKKCDPNICPKSKKNPLFKRNQVEDLYYT